MKIRAFTLIEVLITIAIIGILAGMLLPGIHRSKESARRTLCLNQLRQTQLALQIYAADQNGAFPPRSTQTAWPAQMRGQIQNSSVLQCPSDRPQLNTNTPAPGEFGARSYLMNGFNDVYRDSLTDDEWKRFPKTSYVVRDAQIVHPMDTISFGEKETASSVFYLDLLVAEDYYTVLEERRHNRSAPRGGESNYAWFDGSVRPMKYGKTTCPINLWAISDAWRKKESLCRPR